MPNAECTTPQKHTDNDTLMNESTQSILQSTESTTKRKQDNLILNNTAAAMERHRRTNSDTNNVREIHKTATRRQGINTKRK
jgi:hypothetical protein